MKKTYLATAVATLFVSSITTAIASDALFDDVVVSSSRTEQRSFDAPASIQSINREVIQDSGPQVNMSEALNKVPGVVALNRQNYAQDLQISIRGFGARAKFGVRGVRLITDGIPASIPDGVGQSSTISLTSVEGIEVLSGPLAQLYGNAAGGVIQTFTREAPNEPELLVQGYHGSYGLNRTDWQYAQKIGQFGLVADYATFKTDGFRNNSQAERNQFNGKFTYDHDEKTRLSLIANLFDQPYGHDPAGLTYAQAMSTPQATNKTLNSSKAVNQNQIGGVLTHKLNNESLINFRLYGGNREQDSFSSMTAWSAINRDYSGVGIDYSSSSNIASYPIKYTVGFNYDKSDEINQQGTAVSGVKTGLIRSENRVAQNRDFFGQSTIFITKQFSLLAGARSTSVKLSSKDLIGNAELGQQTFNSINPVIGLTFHALENMNIYANYGRGFETPTLVEIGYENNSDRTAVNNSFNKALTSSKSQHYEAGMKWLPDNRSRVNLALFHIKTKNEIMPDLDDQEESITRTKGTSYLNVGNTVRQGIELAYAAYLLNAFKFDLSLTKMSAYFDQEFTYSGNNVSSGNRLPGVPEEMLFADLIWSSTNFSKNKYKQILGMQLAAELQVMGDLYASFNDTSIAASRAHGYGVANLRAVYRQDIKNTTITTYGQLFNVFDKKYIGSVIMGDSKPFEPAPGRNWVVGLNAITRF